MMGDFKQQMNISEAVSQKKKSFLDVWVSLEEAVWPRHFFAPIAGLVYAMVYWHEAWTFDEDRQYKGRNALELCFCKCRSVTTSNLGLIFKVGLKWML